MILIDSNIVIAMVLPDADALFTWLDGRRRHISAITRVEVLGFHRITDDERRDLEAILAATAEILPTTEIINRAVSLRQIRKMSLGDALIAATALVHRLPLATRNVKDFRWIDGLNLLEPPISTPPP